MRAVDDLTPVKAGGAGFALSALNPKNMLFTVATAAEIAEVGLSAGEQIGVLLVVVLIASVGVLTPVVLSLHSETGRASRSTCSEAGWPATTR